MVDNKDNVSDAITDQPIEVRVGNRVYDLRPRTLKQMRAICKKIVGYKDNLVTATAEVNAKITEKEIEGIFDRLVDMPFDHIILIIQMLYDTRKVFNLKGATISKKIIEEELDFSHVQKLLDSALEIHDISSMLKNIEGLRALS